eukprot:Plantae.Rhodophyta-Hildenbrandia_rubra.ctg3438.p1 GENE.Plantae.Rhodophyta-Hildenbrandia_rubra.ctg3438~~Plantae.Rhodophyta-Hildenbrandia_rubra.ctg3438.p1  ORF type:complete len:739 (+),score=100.20 Plantae.Rhodophyta-Hildenbrandia_rubra.ctg3438:301-2517(+)
MTGAVNPNSRFYDSIPRGRPYLHSSRASVLPYLNGDKLNGSRRFTRKQSRKGPLATALALWRRLLALRWSKSWVKRLNFFHLLFLPALLLLFLEFPYGGSDGESSSPNSIPSVGKQIFADEQPAERGVSLVASCMNRHSALKNVLDAWMKVDGVDEIILVDWSSSPPLKDLVDSIRGSDSRVKLIRVDGEKRWVLSRAYNLAIKAASRDKIIRTDCDYSIGRNFLKSHNLTTNGPKGSRFFAGDYRQARNENEVHLNGAVFINRADFLRIGGYDERIQTYGWDDEDLYGRLTKAGVSKHNISYEHVNHVPHGNEDRVRSRTEFVQVEIDFNRLLLEKLPPWSANTNDISHWTSTGSESSNDVTIHARNIPKALRELVPRKEIDASWDLSLGRRLRDDFEIPWDIMVTMTIKNKERLLRRLESRKASALDPSKPSRVLFAHCMHGLGNRLRALGSAMAFANSTGRELVVIWERDSHIAAKFEDLFATDLVILDSFKPQWPFTDADKWDKAWLEFRVYNYMTKEGNGAQKGEKIVNAPDKHIYYKGAYILEVEDPKLTNWELDNKMLHTLEPVGEVKKALRAHELGGLDSMIGVHIRDRTLNRDIKNVDFKSEYGTEDANTMEYWRQKSSHRTFIPVMRQLLKEDHSLKFYIATDTKEVITILEKQFPGKIVSTKRDCDGRDGHCVRFALIDILCLAKTKQIYGSNWSSFTEAAERFGHKAAKLAGVHFAIDNTKKVVGR